MKTKQILKIFCILLLIASVVFLTACDSDDNGGNTQIPILTTTDVTNITATTATSGGTITSDEGAAVTTRGVCWSANSSEPTITDSKTTDGTGTGSFTSSISGLTANKVYHVRAYATNSKGTGYGASVAFVPTESIQYGTFTDTRTGYKENSYTYKTIKIARDNKIWMAEDLKYLPSVNGTRSDTESRYYVYDYVGSDLNAARNTANYQTYGVLYNWKAAQTACPQGWHLSTYAEWESLAISLNGPNLAGAKLRETGRSHWLYNIPEANDLIGFTALPGGRQNSTTNTPMFVLLREIVYWWTENVSTTDNTKGVNYTTKGDNKILSTENTPKNNGQSVRCVKD